MQDEFHKKGNFLSDALRTNLHGPISSLDAVINNEVGKDGKTEWERLLGEPIGNVLDQETAVKIYQKYEQDLTAYLPKIMTSTPKNPAQIPFNDIILSAFKEYAPDLVQNMETSLKPLTKEDELQSSVAGNLNSLMMEGVAGNGGALRISDATFLITPAETSPKIHAARMMGVFADEVPTHEHMGSEKEWLATDTLHELAHLIGQDYDSWDNKPKNIDEIGRNVREINSVNSSLQLIKPLASQGFPEYYLNARTIGTNYKLVLSLDSSESLGDKNAMMRHAVSNPIQHSNDIQNGKYSLMDYTKDQKSLAEKIRAELGVHDDKFAITSNQVSLRDVTQTVQSMIKEAETSSLCWKCLNDDELELAKDFIKAVDDTGFTEMWNAPQVKPAIYNYDPDLTTSSKIVF